MTQPPQSRNNGELRTPETTREFVTRARAGSLDAFSRIVETYQDRLFNFLRLRTGCDHDAEDIAQETFLRAWRDIGRYDDRYAFSTWLYTIAMRVTIDRKRVRALPLTAVSMANTIESTYAAPADGLSNREQHANLWQLALRVLSDVERSALWLRYAEAMPPATIAIVLKMPAVNVRVMLHRARQRLLEHTNAHAPLPDAVAGNKYAGGAARGGAGSGGAPISGSASACSGGLVSPRINTAMVGQTGS